MARRTGPTISLGLALATCAANVAQVAHADPAEPSFHQAAPLHADVSGAQRPAASETNAQAVQRATYQSPADRRPTGDSSPRAVVPATANHPEAIPLSGPAHETGGSDKSAAHNGRHEPPATPSTGPALISMLGSLAIVLGLFFGLVWFMRRGMPKGTRLLPNEVVEVLGRAPLAARQQMHVVRFGNKLVLLSVSPNGAETLSEIIEPAEVDRLAGICQQTQPNSATNAFRHVFRQFGSDRTAVVTPLGSRTRAAVPSEREDDDV